MRPFFIFASFFLALPTVRAEDERSVVVRVVSAGKPAAGAKVWVYAGEKPAEPAALVADVRGTVEVKVMAKAEWYGSAFARDGAGRIGQIAIHLTQAGDNPGVELELCDTEKRNGRVSDAKGQPIAGAEIVPTWFSRLTGAGNDESKPRFISVPEYQMRNAASRRSHTKTNKARFKAVGIDADRIKSCVPPSTS